MTKTKCSALVAFLCTTALYQATFVVPYRPFMFVGLPKRKAEAA